LYSNNNNYYIHIFYVVHFSLVINKLGLLITVHAEVWKMHWKNNSETYFSNVLPNCNSNSNSLFQAPSILVLLTTSPQISAIKTNRVIQHPPFEQLVPVLIEWHFLNGNDKEVKTKINEGKFQRDEIWLSSRPEESFSIYI